MNINFLSFFPETWIDGETNREFYFTITLKSFEEASDFCLNEGAILFEPKSEDINKRVSDHANTIEGFGNADNRYWIGINDITAEGSFVYNSDQSPISWENWKGNQPNNRAGGQDCGAVNTNEGEWWDDTCTDLRPFVCEKGTSI